MSRFRLGLRSRVTVAFALGGLSLTILVTLITLTITRQVLLSARDDVAEVVVFANARSVSRQLTGDLEPSAVQGVVDSLNTSAGSEPLLLTADGSGRSRDESAFSLDDIPAELQAVAFQGSAGRIRTSVRELSLIHI